MSIVHLRVGASIEQMKSESSTTVPDALTPATELSDLSVIWPLHETVTEDLRVLSVHVPFLPLEKVSLPEMDLPSALMVPVNSAVGH